MNFLVQIGALNLQHWGGLRYTAIHSFQCI